MNALLKLLKKLPEIEEASLGEVKLSTATVMNTFSVEITLKGAQIDETEDGSKVIKIEQLSYDQKNPFWSTKFEIKNYERQIAEAPRPVV